MPAALIRRVAAGLIALAAAAAISAVSAQSEPAIWISEVSAAGSAEEEWFEISNAGDEEVALSGWIVRDALEKEDPLPEVTIPAGGSVVIAAQAGESLDADATIEDGRIGNGLANASDAVALFDEHGQEVDRVAWGSDGVPRARSGRTLQRSSPGAEPVMAEPTPGRVAPPDAEREDEQVSEPARAPLALRISALMPNPESGKEWVELRNHGPEPILINRWHLVIGDETTPLSGVVPPGDYQRIDYLKSELDDERSIVELFYNAVDGPRLLVDRIEYGTDALPVPPAGTELVRDVAWSASGAPAGIGRVRITELMPSPVSGPEWVELANEGDEPVDLAGWQIGDREDLKPLSGVIEPGGRLAVSGIGRGLNDDRDRVRLLGPDGREVDAVEYGTAEIPAPAAGRSIALDQRWIVNLEPSPEGEGVTPALGSLPDSDPEQAGDPPVADADGGGINLWIIVSAGLLALLGVIFLRRFFPLARRGGDGGLPPDGFAAGLDQPPLDFPPEEEEQPPSNEGAHPWDAPQ